MISPLSASPPVTMSTTSPIAHKIVLAAFLILLLFLSWQVLHLFFAPVAWAGILAYVSWPLYRRLHQACGERANLSAALMTLLLALTLILPVVWVMLMLQTEASNAYQSVMATLNQGTLTLPSSLQQLPWIGDELRDMAAHMNSDPHAIKSKLGSLLQHWSGEISSLAGGVGRNLGKLVFALFTVFFFYRDGPKLIRQLQGVLRRYLGHRVDAYLLAAGSTTRAVVYGIVLTAAAQGVLAGIGYAVAGAPSPVFLAALTTLIAMVPFGTPFAWGSVCVWLLLQNQFWPAIGLFFWGAFVVSWVDNIIRPLVISSATAIPFLFVMFGVLGGLAAFGMVGLFIGPVILAVVHAVWMEWVADSVVDDSAIDKS